MITEAGAAISDRTLDSGLALVVGDSRRPPIGRAVVGTLATAAAFVVYVWVAKEVRPLYVHTSWADDPYDAVISFAFFIVPLMVGLCLLRVPLCQRSEPLPVRRAADLLLASRVTLAVVGVTLLSEWVSVILRVNRSTWTDTTRALIGVLGLMTAGAGTVSVGLSRALRSIPAISGNDGPEWAADILLVGERFSFRLGPFGAWPAPATPGAHALSAGLPPVRTPPRKSARDGPSPQGILGAAAYPCHAGHTHDPCRSNLSYRKLEN